MKEQQVIRPDQIDRLRYLITERRLPPRARQWWERVKGSLGNQAENQARHWIEQLETLPIQFRE